MQFFVILVVVCASVSAGSFINFNDLKGYNVTGLDQKLIQKLENHRKDLAEGTWVLPPLDPFVIKKFNFEYANDYANLSATFTNMNVTGITKYVIKSIHIDSDGNFTVSLTEPDLFIRGDYVSAGKIAATVPINGDGDYDDKVQDMNYDIKGKLSENSDGFLRLEEIDLNLNIRRMDFNIRGLNGGAAYNKFVSKLVSDAGPIFINSNIGLFNRWLGKYIKLYINSLLKDVTAQELIDFINKP